MTINIILNFCFFKITHPYYFLMQAKPGKTLPSINSSVAPPPVDI
jgi:hypothetical protein